jgi:integral membrane protein
MRIPDLRDPVGRVRAVGMVEGVSYLILLVCAVVKRLADMPLGVKIFGPIHGGLFLLLILVIFQAWGDKALSLRGAVMAFIASLLPFGPFLIDRKLAKSMPAGDAAD